MKKILLSMASVLMLLATTSCGGSDLVTLFFSALIIPEDCGTDNIQIFVERDHAVHLT